MNRISTTSLLVQKIPLQHRPWAILGASIGSLAIATYSLNSSSQPTKLDKDAGVPPMKRSEFRISVNFMDKLSLKPYLNFFREPSEAIMTYPPGIPQSIRLITVDVKNIREKGFKDGVCVNSINQYFPDYMAKPKKLAGKSKRHIPQKAFVKDMFECTNRRNVVGVQVMEASLRNLNPERLKQNPGNQDMDGPWNQHAWKDEVKLRISGRVKFGDQNRRAEPKWLLPPPRYAYETSIPQSPWWKGISKTQETNKPHAVIIEGGGLEELVPDALGFVQRMCEENGVLFYVINDPRNTKQTHEDVHRALKKLHADLKEKLIRESLVKSGSPVIAFRRGRQQGLQEARLRQNLKDCSQIVGNFVRSFW